MTHSIFHFWYPVMTRNSPSSQYHLSPKYLPKIFSSPFLTWNGITILSCNHFLKCNLVYYSIPHQNSYSNNSFFFVFKILHPIETHSSSQLFIIGWLSQNKWFYVVCKCWFTMSLRTIIFSLHACSVFGKIFSFYSM